MIETICTILYLIMGYFVVRYIHKTIEALPNLLIGLIGIVAWPLLGMFFAIISNKRDLAELVFGKGK